MMALYLNFLFFSLLVSFTSGYLIYNRFPEDVGLPKQHFLGSNNYKKRLLNNNENTHHLIEDDDDDKFDRSDDKGSFRDFDYDSGIEGQYHYPKSYQKVKYSLKVDGIWSDDGGSDLGENDFNIERNCGVDYNPIEFTNSRNELIKHQTNEETRLKSKIKMLKHKLNTLKIQEEAIQKLINLSQKELKDEEKIKHNENRGEKMLKSQNKVLSKSIIKNNDLTTSINMDLRSSIPDNDYKTNTVKAQFMTSPNHVNTFDDEFDKINNKKEQTVDDFFEDDDEKETNSAIPKDEWDIDDHFWNDDFDKNKLKSDIFNLRLKNKADPSDDMFDFESENKNKVNENNNDWGTLSGKTVKLDVGKPIYKYNLFDHEEAPKKKTSNNLFPDLFNFKENDDFDTFSGKNKMNEDNKLFNDHFFESNNAFNFKPEQQENNFERSFFKNPENQEITKHVNERPNDKVSFSAKPPKSNWFHFLTKLF